MVSRLTTTARFPRSCRRNQRPPGAALAACAALAAAHALATPTFAADYRLTLDGVLGAWRQGEILQRGAQDESRTLGGVGLRLGLRYELPRLELGLDYAPTYRRDVDDADLSHTLHLLGLGLVGRPSERTTWTVSERLIQSDTFELVEAIEPESTLVPARSERLTHRFHVDVAHDLTRRALLVAGGDHQARLYDDDELFDGRSTSVFFGGGYRLARAQELRLVGTARRFDVRLDDEDADELDLDLVYLTELGRRGRLELEAGGHRVDTAVEVVERVDELPVRRVARREITGWHGAALVSVDLDRFDANAGYGHYVGSGAGLGRPLLVDELSAGVAFQLHPDVRFAVDARHTRSQLLVEEESAGEANRVSVASLGLHWNPWPVLRLAGGWSIVRQESRLLGFPDVEDRRWFATAGFRLLELGAHEEREARP